VTNSENGGISSEILAKCFKRMDTLGRFPRSPDLPNPFVILDGHGSRLQLPFLNYISEESHQWHAILGLPNGASKWQVGNSKQQNGQMKRHLVLAKRKVTQEKRIMCEPTKIDRTNIIPMINMATPYGFGNVVGNKTAIAERGWRPMNRACLKDTKVFHTRVDKETGALVTKSQKTTLSREEISDLNLNTGTAGNIIGMINQEHGRRAAQN
jgi:hypothetical protein